MIDYLNKRCATCREILPVDLFYKAKVGTHKRQGSCKKCSKQRQRDDYKKNPERMKAHNRRYLAEARQAIFAALGNMCAHCGYCENILGIEIDHIDEDGHIARRSRRNGEGRVTTYRKMLRDIEAGLARLQLLCGTCHSIKTQTARMRKSA